MAKRARVTIHLIFCYLLHLVLLPYLMEETLKHHLLLPELSLQSRGIALDLGGLVVQCKHRQHVFVHKRKYSGDSLYICHLRIVPHLTGVAV